MKKQSKSMIIKKIEIVTNCNETIKMTPDNTYDASKKSDTANEAANETVIETESEIESDKSGCDVFCGCFAMLIVLGSCSSVIALFVVWIVALVDGKTNDIAEKCSDNLLWEWLLVFGLFLFLSLAYVTKSNHEDIYPSCNVFCCSLIVLTGNIVLCWWGNEQFVKEECCVKNNYVDTIFYKTALVLWWFEFVTTTAVTSIIGILVIWLLIYLFIMSCKCGRDAVKKITSDNKNEKYKNVHFAENMLIDDEDEIDTI